MPKPLPWLPNHLHCYGLDVPSLNDGSNLNVPSPDGAENNAGEGEGGRVAGQRKEARDKEEEGVAEAPTDCADSVEEGRGSEEGGTGIGRRTTTQTAAVVVGEGEALPPSTVAPAAASCSAAAAVDMTPSRPSLSGFGGRKKQSKDEGVALGFLECPDLLGLVN